MNWLKSLHVVGLFSLVTIAALVGCTPSDQPPLGRVTGKVTLDGEPLAGVIVNFQPESGRVATAETDAQGNYDLVYIYGTNGTKVGKNTVSFRWPMARKAKSLCRRSIPGHPRSSGRQGRTQHTELGVKIQINALGVDAPRSIRWVCPICD